MKTNLRVLILGGNSYLATNLIDLKMNDFDFFILGRPNASYRTDIPVISPEALATESFDIVLSMTVEYGPQRSLSYMREVNIDYPLKMLKDVTANTVVNISTILPENYSEYSSQKKELESKILSLKNKKTITLLLHSFYGPHFHQPNFFGSLLSQLKTNAPFLVNCPSSERDYIFIDDLVEAISLVLLKSEVIAREEVIEIGSGEAISLKDMAFKAKEILDSSSIITLGAKQDISIPPADITKILSLGWSRKYTFADGIKKIKDVS